ncbi:uncharacterized protein Bfra_010949 [Botrytis fragariae]|uniref:Uncharacterized protein n=1 Tax=Botrytis fragariae TaxID=1964551 RepID=A0A8H6ALU8_9HELO|nr:uncharacterized protein Bfra_010949 [Botrytis fragariae]KAF5869749.1 hypothetical protein Bfra_010949 [Botrytis fragariae]
MCATTTDEDKKAFAQHLQKTFPDLERDSNSSADNDIRVQSNFFIVLGRRAGSIFKDASMWLDKLEAANLDSLKEIQCPCSKFRSYAFLLDLIVEPENSGKLEQNVSQTVEEEYEGKEVGSMISGESGSEYSNQRGRSNSRDAMHREKELCHSRSRNSESEERKHLTTDLIPRMKVMTEADYLRYRDTEELRDLEKDISELEGDNEYMEREMRDIENEHGYEGRYRERDANGDYATSPDSRMFRRGDDSSDVSSMSSMLSVLHESPEES